MKKRLLLVLLSLPLIAACGDNAKASDSNSVSTEEKKTEFTITYILDGGENNPNNPATYSANSGTIILYAATKAGLKFDGWFTDENFTNRISRIAMGTTGDLTFYAKFSVPVFTITYVLNGGENNEANPETYTPEQEVALLPATNEARGLNFEGWHMKSDFSDEEVETIPLGSEGNLVLYAKYDGPYVYSYTDNPGPITLYGREVNVSFKGIDHDTYLQPGNDYKAALEEGTKEFSEFEGLYDDFVDNYYALIDEYRYAGIIADTTANQSDYTLQDKIYSLIGEIETLDQEIDIAAAASPYRHLHFEDMTDDEIDDYIASLNPETSKQINDLQDEMNTVISTYSSGKLDPIEAIKQYSAAANSMATLQGYDNYLDYAYGNIFGREYSVEDSNGLLDYVDVIYKLFRKAYNSYGSSYNSFDADEKTEFDNLNNNFWANYIEYTDAYAELVGGEYLENYQKYFTSGNYFYSSNPNDNVTAYVATFSDGTPLMFMGPDNQMIGTFIHEFGHYNANATGGDIGAYDLSETQSQANEMLFYKYIQDTDMVASKDVAKTYLNYKIASMADTVVVGCLINEVEKVVYGTDISDLTKEKLYNIWDEVCKEAGVGTDYNYYRDNGYVELILLNYHGYYISYAASAIASLEVYALALEDYDKALETYRKIFAKHDEEIDTFTSVLEDSGIYDVFSEDAYALIAEATGIDFKKSA